MNNSKTLPSDINLFAMVQNKIDTWSNYFIDECKKYFPQLYFHENNYNSVDEILDGFSNKMVMGRVRGGVANSMPCRRHGEE